VLAALALFVIVRRRDFVPAGDFVRPRRIVRPGER
jgi:hypothetical protein